MRLCLLVLMKMPAGVLAAGQVGHLPFRYPIAFVNPASAESSGKEQDVVRLAAFRSSCRT